MMRPPETPKTLLRNLSDPAAEDLHWSRLVALYTPVVSAWLRLRGLRDDALEEGTQDVFVRLVRVLRTSPHDPARAHFRTYLGCVVDSVARDRLRRLRADRARLAEAWHNGESVVQPELPIDERLDAQFRLAAYEVVVGRLRRSPDLSPLQREVLESCILGCERPRDVAKRLGRLANTVVQTRRRLLRAIRAEVDALCE